MARNSVYADPSVEQRRVHVGEEVCDLVLDFDHQRERVARVVERVAEPLGRQNGEPVAGAQELLEMPSPAVPAEGE